MVAQLLRLDTTNRDLFINVAKLDEFLDRPLKDSRFKNNIEKYISVANTEVPRIIREQFNSQSDPSNEDMVRVFKIFAGYDGDLKDHLNKQKYNVRNSTKYDKILDLFASVVVDLAVRSQTHIEDHR